MKQQTFYIYLSLIFCSLFTNTITAQLDSTWLTFTSDSGQFKIMTPLIPEHNFKVVKTALGDITYHSIVAQTDDLESDNLVYLVSFCKYPEGAMHSDSTALIEDFFKATLESATKSVKGELIYATDTNYGDYPGKRWRIDYNGGKAVVKSTSYLINDYYYSLQVFTLTEKSLNPSIIKFVNSFRLTEE